MTEATAQFNPITDDPLWKHVTSTWWGELAILVLMAIVLVVLIGFQLIRLDPRRRG